MNRIVVCFCILLLLPVTALGDTAQDITDICNITPSKYSTGRIRNMLDDNYTTSWYILYPNGVYIDISAPPGQEIGGVYIKWHREIPSWRIDVLIDNQWATVIEKTDGYLVEYIELPAETESFRLCQADDDESLFAIVELRIYSPGEIPNEIQVWEPIIEKCDILLISTHPDDEFLFMGGTIPYYLAQGKTVQVVYMTTVTSYRKIELLDALWACKMRNYPIMGPFTDKDVTSLSILYEKHWPLEEVRQFIVQCIRQCKPDVIVTHDLNGEYGHMEHIATAKNTVWAFTRAADTQYDPESIATYGAWQPSKLYLHLYDENQIVMDWSEPLEYYAGESALSMAKIGFTKHRSQYTNGWHSVKDYGDYDCRLFGLYYTEVGEDISKNDFLENIP